MKKQLVAAVLLSFSIHSAYAADPVIVDESKPMGGSYNPVVFDEKTEWTGFYGGVLLGYGNGNVKSITTGGQYFDKSTLRGGLFGATAGYNFQQDAFVYGVEADIAVSNATTGVVCVLVCAEAKTKWLSTLRGRAGYAYDKFLFYGTGGLAVGRVKNNVIPPIAGSLGTYSAIHTGWTVGFGTEYAIDQNMSVKMEFAHIDLGTKTSSPGSLSVANQYKISPKINVIKVGFNMKFQ